MLHARRRRRVPTRPAAALAGCALAALVALACAIASPARGQAPGDVLVVGDSLAVGLQPSLGTLLGGRFTWDARSGRTTPQGLIALRSALLRVRPATVVVSLGTNDGPDPARFADRLHRALAAIPAGACVVWPTIFRPARKGPYLALNRVLRDEAAKNPQLVIVDWDRAVVTGKVALPDGLHPDASGFRYRSEMIAAAARARCAGAARPSPATLGVAGGLSAGAG